MRHGLALLLSGTLGCAATGQPDAEPEPDATAGEDADVDVTRADATPDVWPDLLPDGPIECFGTIYPGVDPINPDDPVYSDAEWTQEEVTAAFAEAKAGNTTAYRAYRAAFELGDILECAFCACGCARLVNHLSSTDCFKDMHGFS